MLMYGELCQTKSISSFTSTPVFWMGSDQQILEMSISRVRVVELDRSRLTALVIPLVWDDSESFVILTGRLRANTRLYCTSYSAKKYTAEQRLQMTDTQ